MLSKVYLMCSLPSLSFGQSPPITLEDFEQTARSQLSAKSYRMLEKMSMQGEDEKVGKAKPKRVNSMMEDLQKDLSEIREAGAAKRQAAPASLPASVLEANPLDREIQIMQWQWEELDTMVASKAFTLSEVIVYKLKLQLLKRMQSFNAEKGAQVLASVVNPPEKKEE